MLGTRAQPEDMVGLRRTSVSQKWFLPPGVSLQTILNSMLADLGCHDLASREGLQTAPTACPSWQGEDSTI